MPVRFRPGTNIDPVTLSLSFSDHFSLEFRLHQFSKTNLTLACLCYTSEEKKAAFEIEILPTGKIELTHTNKLAGLKELRSCDNDYSRCAFL